MWHLIELTMAVGLVALGCADATERAPDGPPAPGARVELAPDGSLRRPFLGGAFVTYNREMPIEIEQAIAGEPTDHPVIVWAGD